jgi:hypothetical protein
LVVVAAVERRGAVLKSVALVAETQQVQRAKVLLARQAAAVGPRKLVEQTDQVEAVTVFHPRSMGLQHSGLAAAVQVVALWEGLAAAAQARIIRP